MEKDDQIYFYKEVLVKSVENRNIDLVTISSLEGQVGEEEDKIDDLLFPESDVHKRPAKFRPNKPIIMISARVHPGETPSSYAMRGLIQFLINKKDARAMLLRKYFVILLIPMLNPDGVYNGHYRMDSLNQNLNRYYILPEFDRQPSCYAIKKLFDFYDQN